MKNILIIANDMEIGGAERALIGLLNEIDTEMYHVDLFLLKHQGPFMSAIPDSIHLLPQNEKYSSLAVPMADVLKKHQYRVLIGRMIGKLKAGIYKKRHGIKGMNSVGIQYSYKYTKNALPQISDKCYDAVIAFTFPYYIPVEKVNAKKRIAWIHTDYTKIAGDRIEEESIWNQYDVLAAVSDGVKNSFIQVFPGLAEKTCVIENILPYKLMMKQAEETIELEDNRIKLLSIGRYTTAKNFDNVPEVCSMILNSGVNICWYIIGYGRDEELIRNKIKAWHMEDHVILLGKKENPYPYIKWCDYYVQPSRFEGQSISVREAQVLKKIVIITNYPTAPAQITDGEDGVIVSLDNKELAAGIIDTINNKSIQDTILSTLNSKDYTKKEEIQKVYQIINEC
ncbi:MAG: glycosyltransferase [Solobacterium sp.]|nr:glycosyltransferase [Solobacterium sp.]